VKRPDNLHVFKVLPRRWVVERTLAWITRHRRTARDYERLEARSGKRMMADRRVWLTRAKALVRCAGVSYRLPRPARPR
jgi:transposase